jgi:shikimate dehydrogenase
MLRCGLLGRTLGHSYSPRIHALLGEYDYRLYPMDPEDLGEFLRWGEFEGLNVTIPYKETVIPYCRALSPTASAIGSVNALIRQPDGSLYGDNTDAAGFKALLRKSGIDPMGRKVLVLGSGGAARTVCHVLREEGAGQIVVISRRGENNYQNLDRHKDAEVIVNTTPLGMYPETEALPIDLRGFPSCCGVLDLIYNPARTRLLLDAEELGIPHRGGLTMLVAQARAASEGFTGQAISRCREDEIENILCREMENLCLIGMPGSGKSTIGALLAKKTGRCFVDADAVVEERAGVSIPELFRLEGEEGFRRRESEVLAQMGKKSSLVIATGGGCVTREENYRSLHQNGRIIFLERMLDTLPREGRPLSQGANLEVMYKSRLPLYQRFADLIIQNDAAPETVADRIWETADEIFNY